MMHIYCPSSLPDGSVVRLAETQTAVGEHSWEKVCVICARLGLIREFAYLCYFRESILYIRYEVLD